TRAFTAPRKYRVRSGKSRTISGRKATSAKILVCCPARGRCSRSSALPIFSALVTSGDHERVHRQLRKFNFLKLFRVCICSEDAVRRKPHPAPLRKAMQCLGVTAADCVYVGDTPEDIQMARRARVRSIGVIGPFPSSARLANAQPDALIHSIAELPTVIVPAEVTGLRSDATGSMTQVPRRARSA